MCVYIYIYIYIYIIYCILHVYLSYIFKYILHFLMFMNLTIYDTKQFMIHNISSPIHYLYLDSTTMVVAFLEIVLLAMSNGGGLVHIS